MKKTFEQFLKIYENNSQVLFKDESSLKSLLLKNEDFAAGEVSDAIVSIAHDFWRTKDMSYTDVLLWVEENLGDLPLLIMQLSKYDGQVCNGGHQQYFDNGYASSNPSGFGSNYKDINTHDDMLFLFKKLGLLDKLKLGKVAYSIMSDFELDFIEEDDECSECRGDGKIECYYCGGNGHIDCDECDGDGVVNDENCSNCDGDGTIECGDCGGDGTVQCDDCGGDGTLEGDTVPDTTLWKTLDTKWYEINEDIMIEFNKYLKSLTLDGDKISNLISVAKEIQKYNL